MRVSRPVIPFLFVILSLMIALPGGVLAKNDKVIREEYSGSDSGFSLCGLTVNGSFSGTFRATIHNWVIGPADPPADTFWIGNINDHGSNTITNTANGKSVNVSWVNNIKEASMIEVGDGYWEYTFSQNGVAVRIGNKPIDRGRIVITQTLYLGDLADDSDDEFVSAEAIFVGGPHPVFFSDEPYCNALLAAIG